VPIRAHAADCRVQQQAGPAGRGDAGAVGARRSEDAVPDPACGEAAQADLAMIRARAALVEARTRLINTAAD